MHGCPPLPPRMQARHSHSRPEGGQTIAHVAPPGHSTGALPTTLALTPFVAHLLPSFCPSHIYLVFFTQRRLPHQSSRHCASALWETLSTTGLPPCHMGSVNKDVERMNVTVSTIPGFGHSLLARGIDRAGGGAVFLSCLAILPLCTKTRENSHRVLPATVLLS